MMEGEEYASLCLELDVASQGKTVREAKAMLVEAVTLYLESVVDSNLPYMRPVPPQEDPRKATPEKVVEVFPIKVEVDIRAHV
jgi:predicted RNase H-like HicB family nuclease